MGHLGAQLTAVEPGFCEIRVPHRADLTQQHGFFHAGVMGSVADSAGGYAAFTLMPPDASVLSVEYKINMLRPAHGTVLITRARVVKPGRSVTVCEAELSVLRDEQEYQCATALMTMMTMYGMKDDME